MSNQLNFQLGVDSTSAVQSINQFFDTFAQGAAKAKGVLNKELGEPLQKEVVITMKGDKAVATQMQALNQTSSKLGALQDALNGKYAKTPALLGRQVALLKELQSNTQKFDSITGKVTEGWRKVGQAIKNAETQLKKMGPGPMQSLGSALQGTIGKFVAVQTLANLATTAIQAMAAAALELAASGAKMEVLQLQLEAFTGSAENADMAMKSFVQTAVKTPFNVEQVANAGRILMGFGVSVDEAVDATEKLAVAASATDGDLGNLARNLGQIQSQGRAYTRDLTQFAIQGIPIWEQMSQVTGKSTVELRKMAEEGQISFEIVKGAISSATREGSAFYELAERMQDTWKGRMEAVATSLQLLAAKFFEMINSFDQATGLVKGTFAAIQGIIAGIGAAFDFAKNNMQEIVSILGAVTAGATAAAVAMNWSAISAGIGKAITALKAFNLVQKAGIVLDAVRAALQGNWAALAAGIAVGAAAYIGINALIDKNIEKEKEKNKALEDSKQVYADQVARQQELVSQYGEIEGRFKALKERQEELDQQFESGAITAEQYASGLQVIKDEMGALVGSAQEARDAVADLDAQLETLKGNRDMAMENFDNQKRAIQDAKRSADEAHESTMRQLSDEKDSIKEKADTAKRGVEDAKRAEDARHEAVTRYLDEETRKVEQASAARMRALEAEKAAVQQTSNQEIAALESQKRAVEAYHNSRLEGIRRTSEAALAALDREKAKVQQITDAALEQVRALSPAEKELAAIRKQKLIDTARNTELTREERLEAQAQLDQMQRAAQEQKIMEDAKRREAELDKQMQAAKEVQAAKEAEILKKKESQLTAIDASIERERQATADKLAAIEQEIAKQKERDDAEKKAIEEKKQAEDDRHKANVNALDAQKLAIDDKAKADIKAIEEAMQAEKDRKDAQDKAFEAQLRQIEDEKREYEKAYQQRKKQLEDQKQAIKDQGKAVRDVQVDVQTLKNYYDELTGSIKAARIEAEKLAAAQAQQGKVTNKTDPSQQSAPRPSGSSFGGYQNSKDYRFAGGPVTGGSSYTVNELGKEAFLSAAGRLSMINAPSFGSWRAPSSGTVIPAYLASQLSIPSGGVRINQGAGGSAAGGSGMSASHVLNRLAGMLGGGGGSVTNNVTIQSANTTKAASDIMVELTKIKRRRYS